MSTRMTLTEMLIVLSIIVIIAALIIGTVGISGCDKKTTSTSDEQQQQKTEQMMQELNRQVGMPNIINFKQKKMMKQVYELCDKEDLICYAYIKSDYTGKLHFIGKCVGYGIPFSAQYTNPEKIIFKRRHLEDSTWVTVPQPDPNGLFMPTSSAATWLMMIDDKGQQRVVYIEPELVVSPFPLHQEE